MRIPNDLRAYSLDLPPPQRLRPSQTAPDPSWCPLLATWGLSCLLAPLCGDLLWAYATSTFTVFTTAPLIIHEAGHVFFAPFGWTLHILGGSLFQLILPGLLVLSFLRRSYRPGIQISLVWWGQNALYVSTYAADAQERALPLITNNLNSHDWWNLLRVAGLPPYDNMVGYAFLRAALLAFGIALLLPQVFL